VTDSPPADAAADFVLGTADLPGVVDALAAQAAELEGEPARELVVVLRCWLARWGADPDPDEVGAVLAAAARMPEPTAPAPEPGPPICRTPGCGGLAVEHIALEGLVACGRVECVELAWEAVRAEDGRK
jgi:hypothetical protein